MPRKLIIFGASGDLARKKLYPALFDLFTRDIKCDQYIGYGRSQFSDQEFQNLVGQSLKEKGETNDREKFSANFKYISGSYDKEGILNLKEELADCQTIYYLSIPTDYNLVENILAGLNAADLINARSRMVFEKPFGNNLVSAKKLNRLLLGYFKENQIYRIDHYLAKGLVRDLFTLRFSNAIFEPLWSNKFIENITIQIKEEIDIESRGEFYDQTGAIRDILQNHALQILALTLMNRPKIISVESIRREKIKILRQLRLYKNGGLKNLKIGQYKGYRESKHIKKDSLTETYASIVAEVDSPRWKGIPITLATGKRLDERSSDIIIKFKFPKNHLWEKTDSRLAQNELHINIQPKNEIKLKLNFNFDPTTRETRAINLRFGFADNQFIFKDAYENALNDVLTEERDLFLGPEEISLSWKFIDAVMAIIDKNRERMLEIY